MNRILLTLTGCFLWTLSAFGQEAFYGNSATRKFFHSSCAEISKIPKALLVRFGSTDDAIRAGYLSTETCTSIAPKTPAKAAAIQAVRLPKLIALTSRPQDYLNKFLVVRARIRLTDKFDWSDDHYSFELDDGSSRMFVYMEKSKAAKLRDAILSRSDGVSGEFQFFIDQPALLYFNRPIGFMFRYGLSR